MAFGRFIIVVVAASGLWSCEAAMAADHSVVKPFMADDVDDVGFVDLTKVDLPAAFEEVVKLGVVPEADIVTGRQQTPAFQEAFAQVTRLGARRVYFLVSPNDLVAGGPTWVIEVAGDGDAAGIVALLKPWTAMIKEKRVVGDFGIVLPQELEVVGNVILGAPSSERLQAIKSALPAKPRPAALAALEALADADAGIVGFGSPDTRRVVREMLPAAPAPFAEIDGKFLDDGLHWISITAKLPPQPKITLTFNAVDAARADVVKQAMVKGLELAKAMELMELASEFPVHRARATALLPVLALQKPQVDGTRVSLTLGDDKEEMNALGALFKMVDDAGDGAHQMNQFKQIALGMLNYESARSSYPPAASHDADGKPLLSWRVLILPFVEQGELYKKFHLDEPWDSEHNRKLIAEMPDIYLEPNRAARRAIGGEGFTTYVVPTGEAMVFAGAEGTKLRDVTDGTSNTILALAVAPRNAVPWTKPDDWQVDLKDPLRDLISDDRRPIVAAYCDGSVRTLPIDLAPEKLAAVLTRAGGETVAP